MKYQHTLRLAGLAGLLSFGVLTLSAAPSGATLVCPPGVTNPAYCTNVLPVATTNDASDIGARQATLNGTSGPGVTGGDTTTYFFNYGRTKGYGQTSDSGTIGPRAQRDVSQQIGSLRACTTYHFRIVSNNTDGYVVGDDNSFTTLAKKPPIKSVDSPGSVRHSTRHTTRTFTVNVSLRDSADVTISLIRPNGKTAKSFDEGSSNGTVSQQFTTPEATGRYTIRVVANPSDCGTQTNDSSLRVR